MIPACDKSVSFFIPANQHHTHYYSGMLMPSCSHYAYNQLIMSVEWMMVAYFKKYLCPHALILQNKQKEYIYLISNNMNTYKVLIQKFVNHRILSFFITVYSILQTSDYIFMLTSSTHRTLLFVLSIIRNCLLTSVTNSNHKCD